MMCANGELFRQDSNQGIYLRCQDMIPPITTVNPVLSGKYYCCKGLIRLVLPISELCASFGSHILFGHINRDQEDKEEQQNLPQTLDLDHCLA
jgi:hypothetical protein